MALSSILEGPAAIKVVKTSTPVEFLASAMRNKHLKALFLAQSSLQPGPYEGIAKERCKFNAIQCRLKFLDMRQVVGDTELLLDYVLYEGDSIEEIGKNFQNL